jgi:small subunit ribosomal protein S18
MSSYSSSSSKKPYSSNKSADSFSPFPAARKSGRKACPFESAKVESIDYKDIQTLRRFISEHGGKILPRRMTGVSFYYQKLLKIAIKRARHMALLPFVSEE